MKLADYHIIYTYAATVAETKRITSEDTDEVRHIVLTIPDRTFSYVEGQSIAVLVPGPHAFGNEDHIRLYSIASPRELDSKRATQVSICVRRCFYIDEISGESYPGVASNYLCDLRPGDEVKIAGPYGKQFLPPHDDTSNLLMIGIGTGIAPFRAFIKGIYGQKGGWKGKVRLFYGAKTGMDLLYLNDKNGDLSNYYDQETFKAFEALSPKPHFDDPAELDKVLKHNAEEVWEMIQDPKTYVYVSGLSRLEKTLDFVMSDFAGSEGNWEGLKEQLIQEQRWSTLFYD